MKKITRYSLFLLAGTILFAGCKKYLDVNTDPNHPLTVPENQILPPVEINLSTVEIGGFYGITCNYWMQVLSLNQALPNIENYFIQPKDANNDWSFTLYPAIQENLKLMIAQAEPAQHNEYTAIAYALMGYTLAITTDRWGDVAWSQALQIDKIITPKYDAQEVVYGDIQNLFDSALYYAAQPASKVAPTSDDLIYGGDMTAWTKWIHMMKARYYLRLSNAPGRTAATQADSALAEVAQGFQSNADNAEVQYPTQDGSPWYNNTLPQEGGVVLADHFIKMLQSTSDPRLPIFAAPATAGSDSGTYVGRPSGTATIYGNYLDFSLVGDFYSDINAPLYLATYSEQLFIQAEATYIKSGATAAQPIYLAAIGADMSMLGVKTADSLAYVPTALSNLTTNPLQAIITEKYIAGFLGVEPWNDWRRTGYPVLPLAQNATQPSIPQRWPYPTQELLANPQPQDSAKLTSRVWWAQ